MAFRDRGNIFRQVRAFCAAGMGLACIAALSACATAAVDDAVPMSASTAAPAAHSDFPAGAVDTATYPNLNVVPVAATAQLTEQERAAKTAELQAARARASAQGPGVTPGHGRPLRRLARTHSGEVLLQIEGQ